MNTRLAVLATAAALLAACATQPQPLQGTFAQISPRDAAATDSTGAMVRWGGRIVQVEPQANRTCFEMISTRLDAYGRPYWASDDTGGRFIACRTGFYDPAVFEKNREVDLHRPHRRLREPPHRRVRLPLPARGGRRRLPVAGARTRRRRHPTGAVAVVGLVVSRRRRQASRDEKSPALPGCFRARSARVPNRPSGAPASRCRWTWNTVCPPSPLQFITTR